MKAPHPCLLHCSNLYVRIDLPVLTCAICFFLGRESKSNVGGGGVLKTKTTHKGTNACGANLNREWGDSGDYKAPSMERSPEVFHALNKLDQTGCDLFVDVRASS